MVRSTGLRLQPAIIEPSHQTIEMTSAWVLFRSKSFDSYMVLYKAQKYTLYSLVRFDATNAHVQGLRCCRHCASFRVISLRPTSCRHGRRLLARYLRGCS